MAKRMKFSVVGLPHYTIWHLYEPSVDDIRHMEEMEKERKAKEAEEAAKKAKESKLKNSFDEKKNEWEKDKATVQELVQQAKKEEKMEAGKGKEDKIGASNGGEVKEKRKAERAEERKEEKA